MTARPFPLALTSLSPAFQVLLACCRHPLTEVDQEHLTACARLPVDWGEFLQLVDRHRIHPQVLASLQQLPAGLVPQTALGPLAAKVREQTWRTLALCADLEQVLQAFKDQALSVIVLKGPPLSQFLFGDVALRVSKDLDLLVKTEEVDRAQALLLEQGYARVGPQLSARQLRHLKRVVTHFNFQGPTGTLIELHQYPARPVGLIPVSETQKWFPELPPAGLLAPTLPPGRVLAYLCVHGSLHCWFRLKWLGDLEAVLKQPHLVDWPSWLAQVKALGLERMVAEGFTLAHHLLRAPVPPPLEAFLKHTRLPEGFLESSLQDLLNSQ